MCLTEFKPSCNPLLQVPFIPWDYIRDKQLTDGDPEGTIWFRALFASASIFPKALFGSTVLLSSVQWVGLFTSSLHK